MSIFDIILGSSMENCVDSPGNETKKGKQNMAESEKSGCDRDCSAGCDYSVPTKTTSVAPGEEVRSKYGKAVASAAIKEMHPESGKDQEAGSRCVDDAEVKAFIEECSKSGEDVAKVVGHIAEREGIDLTAEEPKDQDKARLWSFLIAVLKTWVVDIAQFAAKEIAAGNFDWKSFLWDYVSDKLGGKKQEGREHHCQCRGKDKSADVATTNQVPDKDSEGNNWVVAMRPIMLVPGSFPMVLRKYVIVR